MVINLNDRTTQQLIQAASDQGMTVEEFVRTHLLSTTQSTDATPSKSVTGTMSDYADLLDEVVADAHAARERDRLRIVSDG